MTSYTAKADITVLKNGSVEVVYEVEPGVLVELDEFLKYKKEEAEGKKARLAGEVAAAGKLSKKATVRAFLKKVIEKSKAKKTTTKKENIQKAKEKGLSLLKFKDEGYYVNLTTNDLYKRSPNYELGELVGKFVPPVKDVSFARIIPLSEIEKEKPKAKTAKPKAGGAVGAGAGEEVKPAVSSEEERYNKLEKEYIDTPKGFGLMSYPEEEKKKYYKRLNEITEEKKAILSAYMKKYEGKTITFNDILPQVIKQLKVGDTVVLGESGYYMGDGGDDRDSSGYSFSTTVSKISGRNIELKGGRYRGDENKVYKAHVTDFGWLRSDKKVFLINGISEDELNKGFSGAIHSAIGTLYRDQQMKKKDIKKAEKVTEDWTKSTKDQLVNLLETHLAEKGKRITNLGTATKPKLIELIRKYNIKE